MSAVAHAATPAAEHPEPHTAATGRSRAAADRRSVYPCAWS